MQRQDYIERMIQRVAAAIGRAAGAAQSGRLEEAQQQPDATWSGVLGVRRSDVERLDEATLRMLLNGKLEPAAALLDAEADLLQVRGDDALAAQARRLAAGLRH
jgi:hypothetical protein